MTGSPPAAEPPADTTHSPPPAAADSPAAPASPPADSDPAPPADNDEQGEEEADEGKEDSEHKDEDTKADAWQAVFSPEANAWYFWNSETHETTWTNPRDPSAAAAASSSSSSAAQPATSTDSAAEDGAAEGALPGIDPDLAWLDPSAALKGQAGKGGFAQKGRFNARTGRFQADPAMNPDRISDFQRGHRQQEAYFDVTGWEQQLQGRGIKRGPETEGDDGGKKRPSTKQVDQFRKAKEEKKRKKLNAWLGS
ncbi:hypothetical protein JCM8097_007506 [Rhodosporidiobolus ruineniae]